MKVAKTDFSFIQLPSDISKYNKINEYSMLSIFSKKIVKGSKFERNSMCNLSIGAIFHGILLFTCKTEISNGFFSFISFVIINFELL